MSVLSLPLITKCISILRTEFIRHMPMYEKLHFKRIFNISEYLRAFFLARKAVVTHGQRETTLTTYLSVKTSFSYIPQLSFNSVTCVTFNLLYLS